VQSSGLLAFLWCFAYTLAAFLQQQHPPHQEQLHRVMDGGGEKYHHLVPWLTIDTTEAIENRRRQSMLFQPKRTQGNPLSQNATLLWESPSLHLLPEWAKEYFLWHRIQRESMNETNWNTSETNKYLVMRCLNRDDKCGGASDRLQSIPFALLVAHKLQRVLLIKWERPHPLEEFLQPPASGLDWRVPEWMPLPHRRRPQITTTAHAQRYLRGHDNSTLILEMRHQSHDHGKGYFDEYHLERNNGSSSPSFAEVYAQLWSVVFEPAPPIALLVHQRMSWLGLRPYEYTALHIRSLYTRNRVDNEAMIRNAVQCASMLQHASTGNDAKILVASDSPDVARRAAEWGTRHGKTVVVAAPDDDVQESQSGEVPGNVDNTTKIAAPFHLDRGSNYLTPLKSDWMMHRPRAYYDVFVDLYLLALSQCVAYDLGGFGKWGSLLGGNHTCIVNHVRHSCDWDRIIDPPTPSPVPSKNNRSISTDRLKAVPPSSRTALAQLNGD